MTIDITTATREELAAEVLRLRDERDAMKADLALQRDALMRWREMTASDGPYAALEKLAAGAAWRELAIARGHYLAAAKVDAPLFGLIDAIERAKATLRTLGHEPDDGRWKP